MDGIDHLKGNPLFGTKIKELTNNQTYERIKTGIETANKLDKIYNHSKNLKIGNILPTNREHYDRMNQQGINEAYKKRNNLINRKTKDKMLLIL